MALWAVVAMAAPGLVMAAQPLPKVPTTKIIAIGKLTAKATPAAVAEVLPQEVKDTVELHLAGTIEQWNVRTDKSGVVFVLNMVDPAQARLALDKLPLVKAGLMEFEIIPVGPLSPLAILLPANAH